jgi:hypothetical protein
MLLLLFHWQVCRAQSGIAFESITAAVAAVPVSIKFRLLQLIEIAGLHSTAAAAVLTYDTSTRTLVGHQRDVGAMACWVI